MKTLVAAVTLAAASLSGSVHGEVPAPCTTVQLQAAKAVIDQKLVETSCPEIVYVDGFPDDKKTSYCSNEACVKALKKTKKQLPKCSYDGASVRKGVNKLLKACAKLQGSGDNDDDDKDAPEGADASTTPTATATKTPKPSKTPQPSTPTPTEAQEIGKVMGAGSENGGGDIGTPIATPSTKPTTAPPSLTPTPTTTTPTISTQTTSASSAVRTALTMVVVGLTVVQIRKK